MDIRSSTRRHGIPDEDIIHAWEHAVRLVEYDYDGEERLLVIGPSRSGDMLELVAVPAEVPTRITRRPTPTQPLRLPQVICHAEDDPLRN